MNTILIVDDSNTDSILIGAMLRSNFVMYAKDGIQALEIVASGQHIDLILLDLHMPLLDGFGVMAELNKLKNEIPVMILTNSDEIEKEIKGLELGAVDYIRKPLNILALNKRVDIQLKLIEATKNIKHNNKILEETVRLRTREVLKTNEITINALIRLLEIRNIESSNHSKRTQAMMEVLCKEIVGLDLPGYYLDEKQILDLIHTAPLHDIGKVGIPDSILLKKGKLNPEEFEIMKRHVKFGVEALEFGTSGETFKFDFIKTAKELIGSHHEWFDGSGYPNGLAGTAIPLSGRLMAIIDVYDALTSKRIYKEAMTHQEAMAILYEEKESHFDPVVFQAFLHMQMEILDIVKANSSKT
ncbi:response regulator containing a CheY-like receiver domain and an HD-GYP domain [Sphaerochaeta pleomorpha str. Grapes]|uniref:Response regulator containing a CheY-like receiver domain and an HD-GYP domain n=1 Tax=Sphaerochaeta pleomorpha (strain ATCC BAA-1885 / DSM 22778 / Grapes) TaxID=158190 RepID=G8QT30_SPHPG|nr:HD domain-containing phosphohydrolase [Sphaerochaeta pleomorpha]AEV27935.1 response regulator containing a CheY-like receiver domain and an HD-GYP domain [Sphaerochaeta pleomorpha str. Grapes]